MSTSFKQIIFSLYSIPKVRLAVQVVTFCGLLFASREAFAQGTGVINPIGYDNLFQLISAIIEYGLILITFVAIIYIMISGFKYVTAGGDEKKSEEAKQAVQNAIIGLVIAFSGYVIVKFILIQFLNVDTEYLINFEDRAQDWEI